MQYRAKDGLLIIEHCTLWPVMASTKKMTNYVGGYHVGRAHGLLQVPLTAWLSPGNITDGFRQCCFHGFEHHDARETLLDSYDDVFVNRTAP